MKVPPKALLLLSVASLCAASALLGSRCGRSSEPLPAAEKEAPLPPAPADLLGWAVVPTPDTSWGKLQRTVGGSLGLIPATLGGLMTSLASLDGGLAPEIDGRVPAYFACSGKSDDPGWVLSVHLRDARHARAELAVGDGGRWKTRAAHGMTLLEPTSPSPITVALDGDRVLLARRESDLDALGAYASRALPREPTPSATFMAKVPESGMAAFTAALSAAWKDFEHGAQESERALRDKHGGKQADFADTEAVLAIADELVTARSKELADFASATFTLDVADDALHAALLITPRAGPGPSQELLAGLGAGDAAPLSSSWADARASILLRTTPASRKAHARAVEDALGRALGPRLTDAGKKEVSALLHAWESGVSDALVVSLPSASSRSAFVRVGVADEPSVKEGLSALPPLLSEKAFAGPLGVGQTTTSRKELQGGGFADFTTWMRVADRRHGVPASPLGVASAVDDGAAFVAVGEDPLAVLLAGVRPERKLGDDNLLAAPLAALGSEVSLVVVAQPLKLEPSHLGEPAAPGILAVGKRGPDALVRVDLSMALLRGLLKKGL